MSVPLRPTGAPVRVAVVGAGGIAATHVAGAARHADLLRVVAVADVVADNAHALAEVAGARAYADPLALVGSDVELVVLSTPPSTHVALAEAFLAAGHAVLVEKPLAVDRAGAQRIADAAERSGALVTMASKFRFATDMVAAKAQVRSGALGDVVRFENAFASRVDMTNRWNSDAAVAGGGVLMDNGTHSVDIARFLLGPVVEVLATEAPRGQQIEVDDTVVMLLRTADGVLGSVEVSWSLNRQADRYLAVVGTAGTLEVGWSGGRTWTTGAPAPTSFGTGWDKVQALGANLANVARAVRGVEPLAVTLEDALASVAVVEAAYASLVSGRWEKVV